MGSAVDAFALGEINQLEGDQSNYSLNMMIKKKSSLSRQEGLNQACIGSQVEGEVGLSQEVEFTMKVQ